MSRLEVIVVIEEILFIMRKKMEMFMVYQEMIVCIFMNEQNCFEESEVGVLFGVNIVV